MNAIPMILITPPSLPNSISTTLPAKKITYIHVANPNIPIIIDTAMLNGSTPLSTIAIIIFGALILILNESIIEGGKDAQRPQKSSASPLRLASERRRITGKILPNTLITPRNSNPKYNEFTKYNGSQSEITVVVIEKTGIGTNSRPLLSRDII
ncbi:MAG: hypothetical protein H7Z12_14315 [Rhodospirillaceae bacterium]|nr:hypothetical protein [Rhodospirillales bacterium]